MDRREAIQTFTIMTGGLLGANIISIFLESCNGQSPSGKQKSFTDDEQAIISGMADIIIPRTKVPGAVDAKVPAFISMMMRECYAEKDLKDFHSGLKEFDKWCENKYQSRFKDLSPKLRKEAVKTLDSRVMGKEQPKPGQQVSSFYRNLKGLTILGYYSSKPGATEALRYVQVPGHYDGCIPYHKGDKEWAT